MPVHRSFSIDMVFCRWKCHKQYTEYSAFFEMLLKSHYYTTAILSHFANIFNIEYTLLMRYMGIDYGSKRVGVAVSDEAGEFAMPLIVLQTSKNLLKEIVALAHANKVEQIVLGESKDYKGKPNAIHPESLNLKKDLEGKKFTVHFEPEFMTSTNAERFQGKNNMLDASAAALILQSFLDKLKNK